MSTDLLSQEEIDALLHGVDSGAVKTEGAGSAPDEVRHYDFSTQERIIRGRLPTLEMINDRFARQFRIGLFGILRRTAEISVKGIDLVKFSEYMHSLLVPTNLNLLRVKPLRGTALIVFEPRLVFTMVDGFFGGGRYPAKIEGREFTPTEMRVIQLLLQQAFIDLKEAWAPLMTMDYEYINSEVNPHFANVVTPREHVVVSKFHIDLDGFGGDMHVTYPYSMLEPIRMLLDAGMASDRAEKDDSWSVALREQVRDAEVELTGVLGELRLPLREVIALKAGDVLGFDMPHGIEVRAERMPLYRGQFGNSNGRKAVKVTQVVPAQAGSNRRH
jgi:flagellar motor switch protein FliM